MKKLTKLLMVALVAVILFVTTGCFTDNPAEKQKFTVTFESNGGSVVEDVVVEEGKTLKLPVDPQKENYKFAGWFLEEDFETEVEEDYIVTKNITLYAKWEEVSEVNQIFVSSVSSRTDFVLFEENRKEKDNKKIEFKDLEQQYVVGDDNFWNVKPNVAFIELNVETGAVVNAQPKVSVWSYEVKVEKYDDATQSFVDGSDLVESIDNENCAVDFSSAAIGYTVKVTVTPEGLTEKQIANISQYQVSFECKIIDGYNAYKALDLAYFEKRDESSENTAWTEFKVANGLDVNYHPSAIILHSNIDIKVSDLPSFYFYSEEEVKGAIDAERALGSLKDNKDVFVHDFEPGESFSFEGNYFTLSTKSLREVVRENNEVTPAGEVISHTTLFKYVGSSEGKASFNNISLLGNAPRVENAIKSGGIILTKIAGPEFIAYNNISSAWFITYFPEESLAKTTIEKSRAYDAYNCFVYNWGSDKVYINDCEMIGAGGPVIIQDHVHPESADGKIAKTFITNSVLESFVAGTEGWFKGVGADALIPQIKGLDALFNPFGRSFLKRNADATVTYLNLICINKSGSAESPTAEKIKGELKIDDHASFDFGATNPYLAALLEQTFAMQAPAFQTSVGGFAYGTMSGLFDVTNAQIIDPTNPIYQGEYVCLYYNGMAITFGFNTYSQAGYEVYGQ